MEWIQYFQSLGLILLILSFFPLGMYVYKKFNVKNSSSNYIKILEVKPINYKAQILLIDVQGKKMLIGYSEKGLSFLGELKDDNYRVGNS